MVEKEVSDFVCVRGDILKKSEIEGVSDLQLSYNQYKFSVQVNRQLWVYFFDSKIKLYECRNKLLMDLGVDYAEEVSEYSKN